MIPSALELHSDVLQKTWEGWQEDDGFLLNAAMAYYAAFSLFPLCLVLISILGFVLQLSQQADHTQAVLLEQVKLQMGPWLADQLQTLLLGVKRTPGWAARWGRDTAGRRHRRVSSTRLHFRPHFRRDENRPRQPVSWGSIRSVLRDRLWAFVMLMAVGGLLLCLFAANVYVLSGVRTNLENSAPRGRGGLGLGPFPHQLGDQCPAFRPDLQDLAESQGFSGATPSRADCWSRWSGSLGSVCWVTILIGTSCSAYGIVGSFIAVMIWLYYVSAILFLVAAQPRPRPSRSSPAEARRSTHPFEAWECSACDRLTHFPPVLKSGRELPALEKCSSLEHHPGAVFLGRERAETGRPDFRLLQVGAGHVVVVDAEAEPEALARFHRERACSRCRPRCGRRSAA